MIMISEVPFYGMRPFVHLLLSGVFERFPKLKFVITEGSAASVAAIVKQLDPIIAMVRKGEIGELKYTAENALPRSATEYFQQNVWIGASFPGLADVEVRKSMGPDRFMWGSDYPHDEGTGPYTREAPAPGVQPGRRGRAARHPRRQRGEALRLRPRRARAAGRAVRADGRAEIAQPLDALPDDANEALLRVKRQQDETRRLTRPSTFSRTCVSCGGHVPP